MKKLCNLMMLLLLCSGCKSTNTSVSNSVNNSVSSSNSIVDSMTSTNEYVAVSGISIEILNEVINPNDEVLYSVSILPSNATNKSYTLQTSTNDILRIDGLNVYALSVGTGKLTVKSDDGNFTDMIDVNVTKKNPYKSFEDKFNSFLDNEKNASKVTSSYSYASSLYSEEINLEWYLFDDSLQKNTYENNKVSNQELLFIEDNNLNILSVDEEKASLDKILIGNSSNAITLEEANERISFVNYDDSYGLSNYMKTILNNELTFYHDLIVDNIETTDDNNVITINGECMFLNSYLDEVDSKMEVLANIRYDENSVLEFSYVIKKYTPDLYNNLDLNNPTIIESFNAFVEYNERDINNKLDINDYKVSSFEIDNSNLLNDNNENVIELGETIKLSLIESPKVHLEESYSITVLDSSIIKNTKGLEIKAIGVGTTKVIVTSSFNMSKEIIIRVLAPKVERISFGYIPYFVEVEDKFEISATCYPLNAENREYKMEIVNGNENATLLKKDNGNYEFEAINAGNVVIRATSLENEEIYDEEEINIQAKPDLNEIKTKLSQKTYYHHSSGDVSELSLAIDGSGYLKLEGGGEYSFNWDVNEDFYLSFKNIVTIKAPDRWYDFKVKSGSTVDRECTTINLIIYDLDFDSYVAIQFS